MSGSPVKTPVKTSVKPPKSPKSPKSSKSESILGTGSVVPKFSSTKYSFDITVLKCPVCSDVFNSPRVLPCGHSACFVCLNNLILYTDSCKTRDFFLCPVCQKKTKPKNDIVKQKWATKFPVNATLVRILRNTTTGTIAENTLRRAFCGICLKNNWTKATVSFCNKCLEFQCETCASHHEIALETKTHELTWYVPRKEKKPEVVENPEPLKVQVVKLVKPGKEIPAADEPLTPEANSRASDKKVKIGPIVREKKLGPVIPIPNLVVAQTVTASTGVMGKSVIKLGYFDGKAPGDETVSEFHGIAFLTEGRVAMTDFNNKKIKIFDISHKTRVELISDIVLRANPRAICRVDSNTVAVITERSGSFHIRLLTLRDKIQYFVQKSVEGNPVGIGFMSNTIVCTFKQSNCLHKYRLTRSQQLKTGIIKQEPSGNDLFGSPGIMTSGMMKGCPVMYVADENEFGVTVIATDIIGRKKSSVFFECDEARPKKKVRTADSSVTKSGRLRSRKSTLKLEDTSETTTTESELDKNSKSSGQASGKKSRQSSGSGEKAASAKKRKGELDINKLNIEAMNLRLHHTFPKIPSRSKRFLSPKGRHTERYRRITELQEEISVDLNTAVDGLLGEREIDLLRTPEKRTRQTELKRSSFGDEKLAPIEVIEVSETPKPTTPLRKVDEKGASQTDGQLDKTETDEVFDRPKSVPQMRSKIYRADGIAVDNDGNIYVCMCTSNRVHQTTPDGRVKRDLLSERDGLLGPKAICFSPSNDVFLVTCVNSNQVGMFRMK